jgi:hypothetical protein
MNNGKYGEGSSIEILLLMRLGNSVKFLGISPVNELFDKSK